MTSFWLFLSHLFVESFKFYDFAGNILNWVLFIVASSFFTYWCVQLVSTFGNNKDKEYVSPTEGKHPYYDPKIYKRES